METSNSGNRTSAPANSATMDRKLRELVDSAQNLLWVSKSQDPTRLIGQDRLAQSGVNSIGRAMIRIKDAVNAVYTAAELQPNDTKEDEPRAELRK